MKLNSCEQIAYGKYFVNVVSTMKPGIYYIKDFFKTDPSVPRIARKFYEDVNNNIFPNVTLANKLSNEGYLIK